MSLGRFVHAVKSSSGATVSQASYSAAAICSGSECSVPSLAALSTGSYYWQVLSSNAYGSSWSPNASFSTP